MKRIGFILKTFILLVISTCSCHSNHEPSCDIISPKNGQIFQIGDTVVISVNADDSDGDVFAVAFYIDDLGLGSTSIFPYSYTWNTYDSEPGDHTIKVIAKDIENGSTADEIKILIKGLMDIDGNKYRTIEIGNQEWMAENIKASHYADGTDITFVSKNADWNELEVNDKAYCWYNNDPSFDEIYGPLYNWAGAMKGIPVDNSALSVVQGVCPDGWHLPSDDEWKNLETYIGMSQYDVDLEGKRGYVGGKLKETGTIHWKEPNSGATNEYGFTALPGGMQSGLFASEGFQGTWWSSTLSESKVWLRSLNYSSTFINRRAIDPLNSQYGFSVRCVKD
jgi:uncharacterized protein (TIGR02145 family)